ncbi:MAG: hypothetical protein KDJ47_10385 [Hyphomicrobiaceae bacterium]|nr:hypothetical protein [Hyphomicrobiaceae bacterium]
MLRHAIRLILLVTALSGLVHKPLAAAEATAPVQKPEVAARQTVDYQRQLDRTKLPRPVAEMIDAIMAAAHSGEIEDLRTAIEWNELPPALSGEKIDDPIAFLKAASQDGKGHQMLAIIADLLSVGPARQPLGRDPENTDVYVWPYLAELSLDKLSPAEEVDLYRIVPVDQIVKMRQQKRWTWYRLAIGADGTWHAFIQQD